MRLYVGARGRTRTGKILILSQTRIPIPSPGPGLRRPGFEPGTQAYETCVIPFHYPALVFYSRFVNQLVYYLTSMHIDEDFFKINK